MNEKYRPGKVPFKNEAFKKCLTVSDGPFYHKLRLGEVFLLINGLEKVCICTGKVLLAQKNLFFNLLQSNFGAIVVQVGHLHSLLKTLANYEQLEVHQRG